MLFSRRAVNAGFLQKGAYFSKNSLQLFAPAINQTP